MQHQKVAAVILSPLGEWTTLHFNPESTCALFCADIHQARANTLATRTFVVKNEPSLQASVSVLLPISRLHVAPITFGLDITTLGLGDSVSPGMLDIARDLLSETSQSRLVSELLPYPIPSASPASLAQAEAVGNGEDVIEVVLYFMLLSRSLFQSLLQSLPPLTAPARVSTSTEDKFNGQRWHPLETAFYLLYPLEALIEPCGLFAALGPAPVLSGPPSFANSSLSTAPTVDQVAQTEADADETAAVAASLRSRGLSTVFSLLLSSPPLSAAGSLNPSVWARAHARISALRGAIRHVIFTASALGGALNPLLDTPLLLHELLRPAIAELTIAGGVEWAVGLHPWGVPTITPALSRTFTAPESSVVTASVLGVAESIAIPSRCLTPSAESAFMLTESPYTLANASQTSASDWISCWCAAAGLPVVVAQRLASLEVVSIAAALVSCPRALVTALETKEHEANPVQCNGALARAAAALIAELQDANQHLVTTVSARGMRAAYRISSASNKAPLSPGSAPYPASLFSARIPLAGTVGVAANELELTPLYGPVNSEEELNSLESISASPSPAAPPAFSAPSSNRKRHMATVAVHKLRALWHAAQSLQRRPRTGATLTPPGASGNEVEMTRHATYGSDREGNPELAPTPEAVCVSAPPPEPLIPVLDPAASSLASLAFRTYAQLVGGLVWPLAAGVQVHMGTVVAAVAASVPIKIENSGNEEDDDDQFEALVTRGISSLEKKAIVRLSSFCSHASSRAAATTVASQATAALRSFLLLLRAIERWASSSGGALSILTSIFPSNAVSRTVPSEWAIGDDPIWGIQSVLAATKAETPAVSEALAHLAASQALARRSAVCVYVCLCILTCVPVDVDEVARVLATLPSLPHDAESMQCTPLSSSHAKELVRARARRVVKPLVRFSAALGNSCVPGATVLTSLSSAISALGAPVDVGFSGRLGAGEALEVWARRTALTDIPGLMVAAGIQSEKSLPTKPPQNGGKQRERRVRVYATAPFSWGGELRLKVRVVSAAKVSQLVPPRASIMLVENYVELWDTEAFLTPVLLASSSVTTPCSSPGPVGVGELWVAELRLPAVPPPTRSDSKTECASCPSNTESEYWYEISIISVTPAPTADPSRVSDVWPRAGEAALMHDSQSSAPVVVSALLTLSPQRIPDGTVATVVDVRLTSPTIFVSCPLLPLSSSLSLPVWLAGSPIEDHSKILPCHKWPSDRSCAASLTAAIISLARDVSSGHLHLHEALTFASSLFACASAVSVASAQSCLLDRAAALAEDTSDSSDVNFKMPVCSELKVVLFLTVASARTAIALARDPSARLPHCRLGAHAFMRSLARLSFCCFRSEPWDAVWLLEELPPSSISARRTLRVIVELVSCSSVRSLEPGTKASFPVWAAFLPLINALSIDLTTPDATRLRSTVFTAVCSSSARQITSASWMRVIAVADAAAEPALARARAAAAVSERLLHDDPILRDNDESLNYFGASRELQFGFSTQSDPTVALSSPGCPRLIRGEKALMFSLLPEKEFPLSSVLSSHFTTALDFLDAAGAGAWDIGSREPLSEVGSCEQHATCCPWMSIIHDASLKRSGAAIESELLLSSHIGRFLVLLPLSEWAGAVERLIAAAGAGAGCSSRARARAAARSVTVGAVRKLMSEAMKATHSSGNLISSWIDLISRVPDLFSESHADIILNTLAASESCHTPGTQILALVALNPDSICCTQAIQVLGQTHGLAWVTSMADAVAAGPEATIRTLGSAHEAAKVVRQNWAAAVVKLDATLARIVPHLISHTNTTSAVPLASIPQTAVETTLLLSSPAASKALANVFFSTNPVPSESFLHLCSGMIIADLKGPLSGVSSTTDAVCTVLSWMSSDASCLELAELCANSIAVAGRCITDTGLVLLQDVLSHVAFASEKLPSRALALSLESTATVAKLQRWNSVFNRLMPSKCTPAASLTASVPKTRKAVDRLDFITAIASVASGTNVENSIIAELTSASAAGLVICVGWDASPAQVAAILPLTAACAETSQANPSNSSLFNALIRGANSALFLSFLEKAALVKLPNSKAVDVLDIAKSSLVIAIDQAKEFLQAVCAGNLSPLHDVATPVILASECRRPSSARIVSADDQYSCRLLSSLADSIRYPLSLNICDSDIIAAVQASSTALTAARAVTSALPRVIPLLMSLSGQKGNYSGVTIAAAASHLLLHGSPTMSSLPVELSSLATTLSGGGDVPSALDKCDLSSVPAAASLYSSFVYLPRSHSAWLHEAVAYSDANNSNDILALLCSYVAEKEASSYRLEHRLALALCPPCKTKPTDLLGIGPAPASEAAAVLSALRNMLELLERLRGKLVAFVAHQGSPGADSQGAYFLSRAFSACTPSPTPASDFFVLTKHVNLVKSAIMDDHTASNEVLPLHDSLLTYFDGSRFESLLTHGEAFLVASDPFALRMRSPMLPKAGSEASCVARMSTAASIFRPSTIGSMTGEQVSLLGDPYVSMISDLSNALKSLQRRGASPSLAVLILSSPGIAAEEVSSNPLRFAVADTLEGKAVMGDEDLISVSADAATAPALAVAAKAVVSLWPDAIAAARAQLTWASGWSTPHVSFLATKIAEYVTEKPSSVSLTVSTLLARALESCGVSAALAVMTASNAHLVVQAATDATGGRSCVCLSSEELHTCVLTLAGAAGITNSVAPSGSNSAPTHVVVYSPLAPAAAAVHWALKKMKRLPAHGEVLDCRWVQSISSSVLTHLAASLPPTETRFILAPNALTASALRSLLLALKTTTATSQFFLFSSDIGWTIPRSALAGSFRSATIGRSGRDGVGETMKPLDSTELTSLLGPRFVPSSCLSDKAQKKSTRMSRPRALRVSTGNEEDQGVSNQSTVLGAASNPSQVDEAPSPATPFVQLRSLTAPTQQRRRTARFVTSQTPVAALKKTFASTAGVKPHPLEKPRISVATLTIAHRADAWAAAASCASRWRAVNVTAEMRATGADKSCQLSWFPPHPDAVVASGGIHNFSVYREPLVVPTAINGPRLLMVLDHEDNPLCGDAAAALLFADPLAPEQLRAMTPRAGDTLLLLTVSVEDRETDKSQPLFSFCLANSLTPSFRVSAIERLRQPLSVFFSSATLQPETIASATVSAGMSKRAHLLNDYLAAESTLWAERGSCPWSVAVILLATEISPDAEASWRAVAGDPTALLSAVPSTEQRQAAASFVTCISAASEQAYASKASLLTAAQIFAGVDARTRIGAAALAHAGVSGRHAAAALRLILQSELSRARGDPDAPWIVPNPMVSWWKDRARGDLPAALIVLPQTHPVNTEAISEAGGCIRQLQWTQSQPLFPHPLLRRDMALFSLCLLDSALSSPVKADSEGWSKKQFEVHRGLAAAQANVQDTDSTARSLKGKTDKQASLEHMCALFCVMGSLVETRENSKNESCVELRITLSAVPHSLVESWVRLRVLATGHSFAPTGQDVTCLSLALSSVHACSPGPFLLSSSIGVGGRVLAKFISKTAQVLTHRDAVLDPEKGLSCKTSSGGPPPAAARLLSSAALGSWKVAVADGLPTSWLSWASDIASDSATSAAFVGSPCAHVFLSAAPQYEPFFLGQAEEKVVIQTSSTHPSADLSFITALSKSAVQNPLLQGASSHIEALISGTYPVPENCGSPYPPDARVVPFVATVSRMCSFWSATSVIGAELLFMAIGNAAKSTKGSSGCLQSPLISNATRWPDAAIGAFVAPAISSALAYAHYHSQTSSNTGEVARAILFGAASFVANAGPMSHDACDVLWGRMSQVFAAAAASPEISSSDILVKQGISKTMSDIAASVVKLIESMVVGEGGWVKGTRNAAQTVSKLWFAAASLSDKATTIALRIAFAPAVAIDATDGAASDILDAIRIVCRATPKAAYQVDYLVMGACAAGSVGRTKAWLSERMKSQDSAKPTGGFHILWNACNDSSETGVPYGHVGLFSPPLDVISFMNSFHSPQKRLAIIYAPAPYRSRPLISSMSLALPLQEGSVSQTLSLGPTPFFDEVSSAADGILRRFLRALASGAAVELPRSVKEIPASGATGKMNSEWATLNLAADTGTVVTLTTSTLSNETEECVVLRVHGLLFAASCKVGCRTFIPTVSPSLYSTGGTHPAVQPPAIAMSQALFRSSVSGTDCNIEWEQYLTQAFGSLKCALFSRLVGPRRGGIHLLWTPQIIPAPSDVTSALASSDVSICTLVLARCTSTAMVTKAVDKNQTTVLLCDSSDVRDGRLAEILRVLQMKFATRGCSAVCAVVYCASSFSDGVASMFDRSRLLLAEPQDLSSVDYVDTIISPLAPLSWDNIVAFPAKAALEMNSTVQDLIQYGAKAATHGSDDENSVKKQMQRILKSHPASADAMVRIVRATILSLCPVESTNNLKGSLGHIAVGMGGRHLIRARQLKQDGTFAVFVSSTIGHIAFNAAVTLLKMVESNANRLSIPNQRSFLLARLSLTQHHSTKTSQLKPPHNGDALWTALDSASKRLLSTASGANSSITSQTGAATLVRGFHGALAVALFAVATLAVGRELAQKRGVYESAARLIALVPSTDDTAYPWPWIAAPMSALRKHEPLTNAPRLLTRSKLATSATLQYAVFMSACRLGPMLAGVSAVNHLAQGVLLSLQGSTERDEVMDSLPSASRILAEVERSWNNTGSFKSKFVLASSQTLAEGASLLALETITAAEGMQRPSTSRFRCHDSAVLVSCATSTATIAQNLDRAWSALSVTSQEAVAWALCRRHVGQLWEAGDDSLGENLGLPPRPLTSERDPQWGVPHSLSNPIAFVVQTLLRDAENWSASGNCTLATEAVAAAEGLFLACCHQASLSQASSGFWAVDHANGASMWASGKSFMLGVELTAALATSSSDAIPRRVSRAAQLVLESLGLYSLDMGVLSSSCVFEGSGHGSFPSRAVVPSSLTTVVHEICAARLSLALFSAHPGKEVEALSRVAELLRTSAASFSHNSQAEGLAAGLSALRPVLASEAVEQKSSGHTLLHLGKYIGAELSSVPKAPEPGAWAGIFVASLLTELFAPLASAHSDGSASFCSSTWPCFAATSQKNHGLRPTDVYAAVARALHALGVLARAVPLEVSQWLSSYGYASSSDGVVAPWVHLLCNALKYSPSSAWALASHAIFTCPAVQAATVRVAFLPLLDPNRLISAPKGNRADFRSILRGGACGVGLAWGVHPSVLGLSSFDIEDEDSGIVNDEGEPQGVTASEFGINTETLIRGQPIGSAPAASLKSAEPASNMSPVTKLQNLPVKQKVAIPQLREWLLGDPQSPLDIELENVLFGSSSTLYRVPPTIGHVSEAASLLQEDLPPESSIAVAAEISADSEGDGDDTDQISESMETHRSASNVTRPPTATLNEMLVAEALESVLQNNLNGTESIGSVTMNAVFGHILHREIASGLQIAAGDRDVARNLSSTGLPILLSSAVTALCDAAAKIHETYPELASSSQPLSVAMLLLCAMSAEAMSKTPSLNHLNNVLGSALGRASIDAIFGDVLKTSRDAESLSRENSSSLSIGSPTEALSPPPMLSSFSWAHSDAQQSEELVISASNSWDCTILTDAIDLFLSAEYDDVQDEGDFSDVEQEGVTGKSFRSSHSRSQSRTQLSNSFFEGALQPSPFLLRFIVQLVRHSSWTRAIIALSSPAFEASMPRIARSPIVKALTIAVSHHMRGSSLRKDEAALSFLLPRAPVSVTSTFSNKTSQAGWSIERSFIQSASVHISSDTRAAARIVSQLPLPAEAFSTDLSATEKASVSALLLTMQIEPFAFSNGNRFVQAWEVFSRGELSDSEGRHAIIRSLCESQFGNVRDAASSACCVATFGALWSVFSLPQANAARFQTAHRMHICHNLRMRSFNTAALIADTWGSITSHGGNVSSRNGKLLSRVETRLAALVSSNFLFDGSSPCPSSNTGTPDDEGLSFFSVSDSAEDGRESESVPALHLPQSPSLSRLLMTRVLVHILTALVLGLPPDTTPLSQLCSDPLVSLKMVLPGADSTLLDASAVVNVPQDDPQTQQGGHQELSASARALLLHLHTPHEGDVHFMSSPRSPFDASHHMPRDVSASVSPKADHSSTLSPAPSFASLPDFAALTAATATLPGEALPLEATPGSSESNASFVNCKCGYGLSLTKKAAGIVEGCPSSQWCPSCHASNMEHSLLLRPASGGPMAPTGFALSIIGPRAEGNDQHTLADMNSVKTFSPRFLNPFTFRLLRLCSYATLFAADALQGPPSQAAALMLGAADEVGLRERLWNGVLSEFECLHVVLAAPPAETALRLHIAVERLRRALIAQHNSAGESKRWKWSLPASRDEFEIFAARVTSPAASVPISKLVSNLAEISRWFTWGSLFESPAQLRGEAISVEATRAQKSLHLQACEMNDEKALETSLWLWEYAGINAADSPALLSPFRTQLYEASATDHALVRSIAAPDPSCVSDESLFSIM